MAPRIFSVLLFACFTLCVQAIDLRYDSGYPKAVSYEDNAFPNAEVFFESEFAGLRNFAWKLSKEQEDGTHLHFTYDLYFDEFPVFEQHLKLHWNKKEQAIDYVTSTLEKDFEVEEGPQSRPSWESIQEAAAAKLFNRRNFEGRSKGKLGLWLKDDKNKAFWAYDVEAFPRGPEMGKRGIVSADLSAVFEEKKVIRHWREEEEEEGRATVNLKVWLKYPTDNDGDAGTLIGGATDKSLPSETNTILKNEVAHVRYDAPPGNSFSNLGSTTSLIDITPPDTHVPPADYGSDCTNSSGDCDNQKLDSGNVYYHLTEFRTKKLTEIAGLIGASPYFPSIPVFINYMAKAVQTCFDGTKPTRTQQSDNAAYYSGGCDEEGTIPRCLIFLRHATSNFGVTCISSNLGGSLAREALVVAHEYQHYVTDMISGVEYGAVNAVIVGDVIHEGYSDYFGAIYSGSHVVGEYAFSSSTDLQRVLTSEPQLSQTTAYTSGHTPGLVWASALWELRGELGASLVDQIAFKSLYYLSTSPGFIDSVEALVQADRALTGGVNGDRIRTLFYDERKFIGTLANVFQDGDKKIVKVGFQGCASVKEDSQSSLTFLNWLALVSWILGTLWVGKKTWRKTG